MNDWQYFQPINGWADFNEHQALTDALWECLTTDDWHYLNFTAQSSAWESRKDGTMIRVHYATDRFTEFAVQAGIAGDSIHSLITQFRLAPITTNVA